MVLLLSITAGALFSAGIYMILRRSLVKILVGLILLGYAVNLLLFNTANLIPGRPPLIGLGQLGAPEVYADPVPQALILTAIVISFGITAFIVAPWLRVDSVTFCGCKLFLSFAAVTSF